ncbi:MAG: IS110 family transposase [Saprospiraceae bacterium]
MIKKNKLLSEKELVKKTEKQAFKLFIGIDVSKLKLDVSVLMMGRICTSFEVGNTVKGWKKLHQKVQKLPDYKKENTVFCMESTGIYHLAIAEYLSERGAFTWVENAYQIKHSMGLRRGKSDQTDARNIATYAYRHVDNFRLFTMPSFALKFLEIVHKNRAKLLKIKYQLTLEIKAYESISMDEIAALKRSLSADTVASIERDIQKCEAQMRTIIASDEELKRLFKLVTSVEGVSLLVGAYLLVATGSFKRFTNARKFACQIGIAPFEVSSGTSLHKKKGTSNFADKLGKKMITNAAGCAIRKYGGLRTYYERKIKEGKMPGKVLNAVKNKLLHRIFAVVKSGQPYDKFHEWELKKA